MSGGRSNNPGAYARVSRVDMRYPLPVGAFALVALLVSAWGGLAPFVGPSFGFTGAGGGSFQWGLARALLSVAPAVAGILGALLILSASGSWRLRQGRSVMAVGGLVSTVAGAWFALGWAAWIPLNSGSYLEVGSALRHFAYVVGLAVGPGVLLVACGALVFGFLACASRWRLQEEEDVPPAPLMMPSRTITDVDAPLLSFTDEGLQ